MTVKSGKIMKNEKDVESGRKDVESGRSATTSQNAKFSFLRFFTWLYCTLIAVFGGFWFAQLPNVVGLDDPNARLFVKISVWGFIPGKIVRIYLC